MTNTYFLLVYSAIDQEPVDAVMVVEMLCEMYESHLRQPSEANIPTILKILEERKSKQIEKYKLASLLIERLLLLTIEEGKLRDTKSGPKIAPNTTNVDAACAEIEWELRRAESVKYARLGTVVNQAKAEFLHQSTLFVAVNFVAANDGLVLTRLTQLSQNITQVFIEFIAKDTINRHWLMKPTSVKISWRTKKNENIVPYTTGRWKCDDLQAVHLDSSKVYNIIQKEHYNLHNNQKKSNKLDNIACLRDERLSQALFRNYEHFPLLRMLESVFPRFDAIQKPSFSLQFRFELTHSFQLLKLALFDNLMRISDSVAKGLEWMNREDIQNMADKRSFLHQQSTNLHHTVHARLAWSHIKSFVYYTDKIFKQHLALSSLYTFPHFQDRTVVGIFERSLAELLIIKGRQGIESSLFKTAMNALVAQYNIGETWGVIDQSITSCI